MGAARDSLGGVEGGIMTCGTVMGGSTSGVHEPKRTSSLFRIEAARFTA